MRAEKRSENSKHPKKEVSRVWLDAVSVSNWPRSGWQVDEGFSRVVGDSMWLGLAKERENDRSERPPQFHGTQGKPTPVISRSRDLGDGIMTAIVLAPFGHFPILFTNLARLRLQECERVVGLRTELTRCGAKVVEEGNTLTVYPSELHGAEIETYNDHRMAMCFATLGLKVPGMKIRNPACVKKTFPNFFQKFVTPPPHGLGATILDAKTGRVLDVDDLFAA